MDAEVKPLDKFQELQAMHMTADYARRHGTSDPILLSGVAGMYRQAIALGVLDEVEKAVQQKRGAE